MVEEMKALEKYNTWELTTLPEGKRTVGCKWVFILKYNPNGTRYKARLAAKGYSIVWG